MSSGTTRDRVVVVGAGIAGLAAARTLSQHGIHPLVLERSDAPGGRVRTDLVAGFRLDRGFQILLTAYPEAERMLDYRALDLRAFEPGALVRVDGRFHRVGDPRRRPGDLPGTLRAPIGTLGDKLRVLRLRRDVRRGTVEALWDQPDTSARARLERTGFSPTMIDRFLRPLFAGVTLDADLAGSSRVLEFVFRMLSDGDAAVPADGMGAVPDQLAASLPPDTLELNTAVNEVAVDRVVVDDGAVVDAAAVIVATDLADASALTGIEERGWRGTTTWWFAAAEAPVEGAVLVLDGDGGGPVTNLAVLSNVSERYAPPGRALIAASAPGTGDDVDPRVRDQLASWFPSAADWELLRTDRIARAQPAQPPSFAPSGPRTESGVYLAGDHCHDASINGALLSGRRAAQAVISDLRGQAHGHRLGAG